MREVERYSFDVIEPGGRRVKNYLFSIEVVLIWES